MITDDSLSLDVKITDAERIVHFDIPEIVKFNERLWCMQESYKTTPDITEGKVECGAFIKNSIDFNLTGMSRYYINAKMI